MNVDETGAVVVINGLSRRFGPNVALDEVNLAVPRGVVFGVVGENGAGKTTLIKHVMGLLKAQAGSVRVFGLDPVREPVGVLSRVGYLSEDRDLPDWMRIAELIRYLRPFYPAWDDGYAELLREQFDLDPGARIKGLSQGQRARVGLLAALAYRPDLLVLDEPSTGLDPVVRRDILTAIIRTIAEEGRTVLFSSHLLDEVERVSDHVAMIDRGKIVLCDALDAIKASYRRLTLRFDEPQVQAPALRGSLVCEGSGHEWTVVCGGSAVDIAGEAAGHGARVVEERTPSLDEIFVARVAPAAAVVLWRYSPMHSPAFAIAWQLWTRHRSGIVIALATLVAMLASSPLLPLVARVIASSLVLLLVIGYFMNILLFTDSVGGMDSTYPRRMYALPVPTRTLVGWPMLYGGGIVALLWVSGACLVYRPSGFQTPVLIPALGLAALLVWVQAFAWSPIKNPVLKMWGPLSLIPLLAALPVWMFQLWHRAPLEEAMTGLPVDWSTLEAMQPVVLALLVAYIAMAYAVARAGIMSDRRGDTWQVLPGGFPHFLIVPRSVQSRRTFRSPAEAQLWYEWDCHGLVIPVAYGVLLLLMCGVTFFRHGVGVAISLMLFFVFQVSTAGVLSFSLGGPRPFWVKSRAFITFLATRPMNSGALVAAKLRMTALSLLLMFAITAVEIAIWIVATGYTEEAGALGRLFLSAFPGWRAAAVLVLGAVTLPVFTWGLATSGFALVLAGRNWILVSFNLAVMACAMGFGVAVVGLTHDPASQARLIAALPWLVAMATGIKLIVAFLAFRACRRHGLIGIRSIIILIAAALAVAACAIGLAALLSEAQLLPVPISVVVLGVVALVPLGRLALAPLALEWNRHR